MPQPAYSTWATYSVLDSDDEEMILKKAIYAVESEMTPQFINKTKWIYNQLSDDKKLSLLSYIERILFPELRGGLPTHRDAQLYDKGFIYRDVDQVLRAIHKPARCALQMLHTTNTRRKQD